ncbi:LOG family protein [Luteimonas sp. e5]
MSTHPTPPASICVYCGSRSGVRAEYAQLAVQLGRRIAGNGQTLVYGGGNVGLMGVLADAALAAGGEVIGIIPQSLLGAEMAHPGVSRLEVVESMHLRKARMFELADAFIALPGGFGTLEEMFEMLTWRQIGLGNKPCAFLDSAGFWRPLAAMLDNMLAEGFIHPAQREDFWLGNDIDALFAWIADYVPAAADTWQRDKRPHSLPR